MEKKRYTMEDFREGGLAVAVQNKSERDKFLRMCERDGIVWNNGEKATEFIPNYACPYALICGHDKAERLTCLNSTTGAISLSDIDDSRRAHRYHIIIGCSDNKTTVAHLLVDGREVKRREARCNPADAFSLRKGAEMAFGRLWDKKVKEKKPAVHEVKRQAKVGEWVKIVAPYCTQGSYHLGDIIQAKFTYGNGIVGAKGISVSIVPSEYVVLEGYKSRQENHAGGKDREN